MTIGQYSLPGPYQGPIKPTGLPETLYMAGSCIWPGTLYIGYLPGYRMTGTLYLGTQSQMYIYTGLTLAVTDVQEVRKEGGAGRPGRALPTKEVHIWPDMTLYGPIWPK